MISELLPELLALVFKILAEEQDIVTLIRLRLTCGGFNQGLFKHKFVLPQDIPLLIRHGHLKLLPDIANDELFSEDSMTEAIKYDQTEIVQWLHERLVNISTHHYKRAVYQGKFKVLEYLDTIPIVIINTTGKNFKYQKTKNLAEVWQRYKFGRVAVLGRRLDVLKWAYSRGLILESILFAAAIWIGDVEIINWLQEHECPVDQTLLELKYFDFIEDKFINNIFL